MREFFFSSVFGPRFLFFFVANFFHIFPSNLKKQKQKNKSKNLGSAHARRDTFIIKVTLQTLHFLK